MKYAQLKKKQKTVAEMDLTRTYLFLKKRHPCGSVGISKSRTRLSNWTELNCGSADKEYACNAGDLGSIPGLGRSPGEGKDYPLQYSGLENSMDCIVHGVAKSQTQLSDFHFPLPKLFQDLSSHSGSEFSAMVCGTFHYL